MTVRVEPMVNMGQLTHFLIPKGYTLPVLPEMDDLTVGGLVMGVGIESSSHKYGLFNDKCNLLACEIILADGKVVKCSPDENSDLYDAIPWSYGTLGFLASATLRIIKCKEFVHIKYHACKTQQEAVKLFKELSEQGGEDAPDFVEALSYSHDEMVIMPAWFASKKDHPKLSVNTLSLWYKPWFYKYVQGYLSKSKPGEELLPLRDYYHRHTKSIFWELEQIIPVGNHPLFRLLLGWAVPPKVSFLKLTQTEGIRQLYETQHVIQDMLVPVDHMKEALDVFDAKYNVYPLWVCPYKAFDYTTKQVPHRSFLRKPVGVKQGQDFEMHVDLGAYGIPKAVLDKKPFDIVAISREVEDYVRKTNGFQMLYADSYMNEEEFVSMFDHTHYYTMKTKYDPRSRFPKVYQKTCKKAAAMYGQDKKAK